MASEAENRIEKILVATDFSAPAGAAVAIATELAARQGALLTVLHAVELSPSRPDYVSPETGLGEELRRAALARLEQEIASLERPGLELAARLVTGPSDDAILDVAEEIVPDLVVLGTRGHTGLAHLLLGSTAERVVQRCARPVLTVHEEAVKTPPSELSTALAATDFSPPARRAARLAGRLVAGRPGARLILFHAYHLPIEYSTYGTAPVDPAFLEEARIRAEGDLADLSSDLAEELGKGVEIVTEARPGYPVAEILELAEQEGADVIALGTQGHTGATHLLLGSTAERVVQRAPCPVLTVRKKRDDE